MRKERNDGKGKAAIKLFSATAGCSLLIHVFGQKDVRLQAFWLKLSRLVSEEFLPVKSTLVFFYPRLTVLDFCMILGYSKMLSTAKPNSENSNNYHSGCPQLSEVFWEGRQSEYLFLRVFAFPFVLPLKIDVGQSKQEIQEK